MNRFVIADPRLCIGCGTCMAACSAVHRARGLQSHPRLTLIRDEQSTMPIQCHHCEEAPCRKVCPVQAISLREQSVHLDETLCIGCHLCAVACPFGAIASSGSRPVAMASSYDTCMANSLRSANPATAGAEACFGRELLAWVPGIRSIAVKCDLCHFRSDGPACIAACPTRALRLVEAPRRPVPGALAVGSVDREAEQGGRS